MANKNITVGTMAIAKVGRNAIEVEIIAQADGGAYRVRNKAGKEFTARRLEAKPMTADGAKTTANEVVLPNPDLSTQPEEKAKASREASAIPCIETTAKHLSLMNAAVEVLRQSEQPLNTREIVARAVGQGLWTPTGAKTPGQTLYGAIFREIATKEHPRIVKSKQKSKFELNCEA